VNLGDLGFENLRQQLRHRGVFVRTGPFVCHLRSPLCDVAEAIDFAYADFPLVDRGGFADFHVRLARPPGLRRWVRPQVQFYLDGRASLKPFPVRLAVPMLEWGLNWCVASQAHQYMMIHAAALERDGHAVLLVGRPGAGKSTLCAALVFNGWRLFSDEIALVRPDDLRLVPLPRPISLKNESIEVIRRFAPGARIPWQWEDTTKGTVAHLAPPTDSVLRADQTAPAAWVVFLDYQPDADTRSRRLPRGTALMRLARNAFNYCLLGSQGFETMARLIESSACYEFRYSDLNKAIARFDTLPQPDRDHAGS